MTLQIHFLPPAENEFNESLLWYESRLGGLGIRFKNAVENTLEKIQLNPETYTKGKRGFREAPVSGFPFKIIFYLSKKEGIIFISSVFHTSRNPRRKYRKR